jgi:regulator of protease activity HflC (stomatin/prohibitin superfamily)
MIVAVILTVLSAIGVLSAVKRVPAGNAYVVERLGRYLRTLEPGVHVILPFLDRVAFRFSLAPKEEQFAQQCISLDNVPVTLAGRWRWNVEDAHAAAYQSPEVSSFVGAAVREGVRNAAAAYRAGDLRESTRELQLGIMRAASAPSATVGVKLLSVDVERIERL